MATTVEIYGLYDPDTNELRYVGKANDAAKRLKTHLLERKLLRPVNRWVSGLISKGKAPVMRVLEVVSAEEWEIAERRLIAKHRASCHLLNLADGGAMPSQTKDQRKNAARASNKAQASKHPAEIAFIKAKQDMARLLARFTKDGHKSGNYFHAYVVRFIMRCYYANDPEGHASWANL
jgi:hypothetical protein